jgi:hypothetical protein
MYRDNLEALRQRSGELDRALAELPPRPTTAQFPAWYGKAMALSALFGAIFLIAGLDDLAGAKRMTVAHQAQQAAMRQIAAPSPAPEQWVAASIVSGRNAGARCAVLVSAPCRANIVCDGIILYHGAGTCAGDRYLDPADSMLDDTPQCVIDFARKRAVVRELECHRRFHSDHYQPAWESVLELQ